MAIAARRALLVATSEYEDAEFHPLRAPAGDALALAEVLADPAIGGFDVEPPLVNRPKREVELRIDEFFEAAREHDFLLLYITGHGVLSSRNALYYAMTDTVRRRLRPTGVADSVLSEAIEQSYANQVVVMLDCCHSGASQASLAAKGGGEDEVGYEQRFGGGVVTLASSGRIEYAFEEGGGTVDRGWHEPGSLFTRLVVEGLRTGDADAAPADGEIHLTELHRYVNRRMKSLTRGQTPELTGRFFGEPTYLARNPRAIAEEPALSPPARKRTRGALPAELVQVYEKTGVVVDTAIAAGRLDAAYDLRDFERGLADDGADLLGCHGLMARRGLEPAWVLTPQGLDAARWRRLVPGLTTDRWYGDGSPLDDRLWELCLISAAQTAVAVKIDGTMPASLAAQLASLPWVFPGASPPQLVSQCSPGVADYLALAFAGIVGVGATILRDEVAGRRFVGWWDNGVRYHAIGYRHDVDSGYRIEAVRMTSSLPFASWRAAPLRPFVRARDMRRAGPTP